MPNPTGSDSWRYLIYFFLGLAVVLICLQIWSVIATRSIVTDAMQAVISEQPDVLARESARQELIGRRIENETKGIIQNLLATGFAALAAALVTISGAILALRTYLDAREKERLDRLDAQQKDRQDQLARTLNETLTRLVSNESRQRVVGAASLLPFFAPERSEFHLQALTALVAAARIKDEEPEVQQGIRIAVERAIRTVSHEVLSEISWQGVRLPSVNLADRNLRGLDLRNAVLKDAKLTQTNLDDADLAAAELQGAQLQSASLRNTNLAYADLAGASIAKAQLSGAKLDGIKVLNLDLERANMRRLASGWRGVPWDATRNWRQAEFDADMRQELDAIYGPAAPDLRVLMLMWEMPPLVAGGTWTACYHLVRNLRRRGANVTIVIPWDRKSIVETPFGAEVPIIPLGIVPPDDQDSVYGSGSPSWSSYGASGARSMSQSWSPYGWRVPSWSAYGGAASPYWSVSGSPYWSAYGNAGGRSSLSGSILYRLIGEFRRRLEAHMRDHAFDLIHAHDWVTFDAAREAASRANIPWIAHFHSTEADRQPDGSDPLTERIEQGAVDAATRIVAPSKVTRETIITAYHADPGKLDVVPNGLSDGASSTADMGRFETKRVVFVGRLSRQKGVNYFGAIADAARKAKLGGKL